MHLYEGYEELRESTESISKAMAEQINKPCFCGSQDIVREEIETFPKFPDVTSTATLCTCQKCERQWEEAWVITYSMCILKMGKEGI